MHDRFSIRRRAGSTAADAQLDQIAPGADSNDLVEKDGNGAYESAQFMVAELAALRRERSRLRHELTARTEAWRTVLRELSDVQAELAELKREVASRAPEPLTESDWDDIIGSPTDLDVQ